MHKFIYRNLYGMPWLCLLLSTHLLTAQVKLQLTPFATGFSLPVDIAHCGDSRLFIVEQRGYVWILDSLGNKQNTPFLNIDARVNSNGNEQGLLGIAFHPDFAQNGWFFVNYTRDNGDTRISRFNLLPGSTTEADPASEKILLEIDQPYSNHNGGCVKFGPDGYLYASLGDGGSGGDPQNNSQKKSTFLGKMLRLDVNVADAPYYSVPADNPFVGQSDYLPEIWALGLRNVWRFSFDRQTGDMWMGDVGQNDWEEIDFEPANTGGRNYGWRCYEGTHSYNTSNCQPAASYVAPAYEYQHTGSNGCSVTGGFIYRGSKYPDLQGQYIFADYCSGRFWRTVPDGAGGFTTSVIQTLSAYQYSSFGEDVNGELYVASLGSGKIEKIRELCSAMQISAVQTVPCPGSNTGSITITPTGGTMPYTYIWTGGLTGKTVTNLAPGTYTVQVQDANTCVRRDTFTIEAQPSLGMPAISFASGQPVICPNDTVSVILQASSPAFQATYQWYLDGAPISGATSATLNVSDQFISGAYSVQWVDVATGCTSEFAQAQSVTAFNPVLTSLFYNNGVLKLDDPFIGNVQYQWYLDGNIIPGATGETFVPTQSGLYALEVSVPEGCVLLYTEQVTVSTQDIPSVKAFALTPNPAGRQVSVDLLLNESQQVRFVITDQTGRVLHQSNAEGAHITRLIDLSGWPSGTYLFIADTENGRLARKLVKY